MNRFVYHAKLDKKKRIYKLKIKKEGIANRFNTHSFCQWVELTK